MSKSTSQRDKELQDLRKRLQHLNEERLRALQALELAGSISSFDCSLNKLQSHLPILKETAFKCHTLAPCTAMCFCLVNEQDNDIIIDYCTPDENRQAFEQEVDALIEDGDFAWALERNRPHIIRGRHVASDLMLHSLSTPSRIRGMFLAFLAGDRSSLGDISLSLVSVVMQACAHMLESYALYSMLREDSTDLEQRLRDSRQAQEHLDRKQHRLQRQTLRLEAALHEEREQRLRLEQQLEAETLHAAAMRDILRSLVPSASAHGALQCAFETCMRITGSNEGALGLFNAAGSRLRCWQVTPELQRLCDNEQALPVLDLKHALGVSMVSAHAPQIGKTRLGSATGKERDYLFVPLWHKAGLTSLQDMAVSQPQGCMLLMDPAQGYQRREMAFAEEIADIFGPALHAMMG